MVFKTKQDGDITGCKLYVAAHGYYGKYSNNKKGLQGFDPINIQYVAYPCICPTFTDSSR